MRLSVPAEGGREGGGILGRSVNVGRGGEAGKRVWKDWDDASRGLRRGGRIGSWWRELRAVADRVGAVEGNN